MMSPPEFLQHAQDCAYNYVNKELDMPELPTLSLKCSAFSSHANLLW